MENKVIILGAGIGTITMGFEKAGCEIVAAYEKDKKAIELYQKNLNSKVDELDQLFLTPEDLPEADILACDISGNSFRVNVIASKAVDEFDDAIKIIINYKVPKIICLFGPQGILHTKQFEQFIKFINDKGYNYKYTSISTGKVTGQPILETKAYLVATHRSMEETFEFPYFDGKEKVSLDDIFEDKRVNDFYYKINYDQIREQSTEDTFLLWKQNQYEESSCANINLIKVPLVRKKKVVRKITHRELARLKNISDSYQLDIRNKSWMYKKLMYAPNVKVIEQIARKINDMSENNILQRAHEMKEMMFANIFERYLTKKCENVKSVKSEKWWDYVYCEQGKEICFKLKFYNSEYAIEKNIKRNCERLFACKKDNTVILVIANAVSKEIKEKYYDLYGIYIWDVKNLLYLFDEYVDIKNEFIALLTYSINDLQVESPELQLFEKRPSGKNEKTWEERLNEIQPGKKDSKEYEKICTEILKNVLGEYLTLWSEQKPSNGGLHRFDMCCKIKNGVNQDFFNIIQNYYNTKYIVFEFKNYEEQITQKEIYMTEKYLYKKALRSVAIIVSRKGANENALSAARGCLRESGKLILCLSDDNLKELIRIKEKDETPTADFFETMLDELLINLEK